MTVINGFDHIWEKNVKRNFRGFIRPLLFGVAFIAAATTAHAMPIGNACSGSEALGVCFNLGLPFSLCCAWFGM